MPLPFFIPGNMNVKINLQAIRTAETILAKPFSDFDLSDDETLKVLMYGAVSENNDETFTLKTFEYVLESEKVRKEIFAKFAKEMDYIMQFAKEEDSKEEDDNKSMYMGELAAFLIQSGMSAEFVLYKMRLFEIPDYVKAIEDKRKEHMEQNRFWSYLGILPHVDGKKLTSPDKLVTFPWEAEDIAKAKEAEFDRGVRMFEKFMKSKPRKPKQI